MADVGRNGREGFSTLAICLIETRRRRSSRRTRVRVFTWNSRVKRERERERTGGGEKEGERSSIGTHKERKREHGSNMCHDFIIIYTGWHPRALYLVAAFCFPDRIGAPLLGDASVTGFDAVDATGR